MAKRKTSSTAPRIENPKTGAEVLQFAQQAIQDKAREKLKNLFLKISKMISDRELWIANRTNQIARLKKYQAGLVKTFDAGRLGDAEIGEVERLLASLDGEKVSKSRFVNEDEEEDDDFLA